MRPPRLPRVAYAPTGGRGSRQLDLEDADEERYQLEATKPAARSGKFTKIARINTFENALFAIRIGVDDLRVLEGELAATATGVRYAGEARWPQRRPSMTPDVYATPGSIRSTQRAAKCPKYRFIKKSTTSDEIAFLIKKHLYILKSLKTTFFCQLCNLA